MESSWPRRLSEGFCSGAAVLQERWCCAREQAGFGSKHRNCCDAPDRLLELRSRRVRLAGKLPARVVPSTKVGYSVPAHTHRHRQAEPDDSKKS